MNILNYPLEIWIAVFVAVVVRLKTSVTLNWTEAISTILVAVGSGVVLYQPITTLVGLGSDWSLLMAILIALTAENLMKGIVDFSEDRDAVKNLVVGVVGAVFPRFAEKLGKTKQDGSDT